LFRKTIGPSPVGRGCALATLEHRCKLLLSCDLPGSVLPRAAAERRYLNAAWFG